jgi:two-component system sensor histidine kinase/response regulator
LANKNPRVLVVDDEQANITILGVILSTHYQVSVALNGEQALQTAIETLPDLILLDVVMPGMDGFETCRRLKAMQKTCEIPVIFASSLDQTISKVEGFDAGAVDFVSKPLEKEEVLARVRTHIMLHQQLLELEHTKHRYQIAKVQAEKANEEKTHLVAIISHELRTPLAVCKSMIEALLDGIRPSSKDNLGELNAQIDHLNMLINDLFELSVADLKDYRYTKEAIDSLLVLEDAVKRQQPMYDDKKLKIFLQKGTITEAIVKGDPGRLTQLFDNIIFNSYKYTDAGGQLSIEVTTQQEEVVISFQDSEPGLQDYNLSKLFDIFYRVEKSRDRQSGGAGLGLTICKKIVEKHHGTIVADRSNLGGLSITIALPLDKTYYN